MAAPSISLPRILNFIFTEKLGSGTYATVYKAYKKGGRREVVAVKCVEKSSLNRVTTENLLTEIELLKGMKHEHIVELKDFQWDDKYIYLIMEYCSGGDLQHFIQTRRKLPEHIVKKFLQQLVKALQYMRSKNIAHMDLKPQNILLSSSENPVLKIADFGFAHYLFEDTDVDHLRGSPLYMAPEIIIHRHYDPKADLWSVGVILYECLFGKAPFASNSYKELGEKIRDSKPIEIPYGANLSDKCRDFLLRLLQRDPNQRITFEDFFDHPFVDLEHMPSPDCLEKAIALVKKAIEKDAKKDHSSAVQYYCEALDYFVPAIHYETDLQKKKTLRVKVQEYMGRAEELKQLLKPSVPIIHRCISENRMSELQKLSQDSEEIKAALKIIEVAEFKEEHEHFEAATEQYELALGAFIKILQNEPGGRRKEILHQQVTQWMSRAEKIKNFLQMRKLQIKSSQQQVENEEKERREYTDKYCVIQ